jgi:hypothetical protein
VVIVTTTGQQIMTSLKKAEPEDDRFTVVMKAVNGLVIRE